MRCNDCGHDNSEDHRFCGQCGSRLLRQGVGNAAKEHPAGAVLTSFREDIERQRAELNDIRRQRSGTDRPTSDGTPPVTQPLSKLATAPSGFGPSVDFGAAAPREPAARTAAKEWFSPPREIVNTNAPLTGPSFLGLSDPEPVENADLAYLYEDEVIAGRGRRWIVALIAIALVGFSAYEWRAHPEWQSGAAGWTRQAWQRGAGATAASRSPVPSAPSSNPVPPTSADVGAPVPGSTQAGNPRPEPARGNTERSSSRADHTGTVDGTVTQSSGATPNGAEAGTSTEGKPTSAAAVASASASAKDTSARTRTAGDNKSAASSGAGSPKSQQPENALVAKADGYLYGRGGLPKNCDQALVYLRTAADHGNATASSKLGGLYATGNCVPLDRARAYNWFTRARQAGDHNIWTERNMSMLWAAMTPEEKARVGR